MSQYWTIYSVKHQIFRIENKNCTKNVVQTTLSLNDVFNVNVVFKWGINDWRIESILIGWLIPYCVVIGWHIFQFTLISYKIFYHYGRRSELVKKKEWALLLFIPLLFSVNLNLFLHWFLQMAPEELLSFLVCFVFALLILRLCFGSLCFTEAMAEVILSKLRGTPKVYLCLVENSSKEVNDILETFLSVGSFDTIIRLNTLTTSILNK